MTRPGIGTPNGPADLAGLLDLGEMQYLIVDIPGVTEDQVAQIRRRYPGARIILRYYPSLPHPSEDVRGHARAFSERATALMYSTGLLEWQVWNEPEIEGDRTPAEVGQTALTLIPAIKKACPWIRLGWGPWAHMHGYARPSGQSMPSALDRLGDWKAAADLCDFLIYHAYIDPAWVDRIEQWSGSFFPGKPWILGEWNYGLGQPRPPDYGDRVYDLFRRADAAPLCEGAFLFIAEWIGGPTSELDVLKDPDALNGLRRATVDFSRPAPAPEPPPPLDPLPDDWIDRNLPEDAVPTRDDLIALARRIAATYRIDPDLFQRQIQQESGFNPNAVSPSGAEGLGQLMPAYYPNIDRFDPGANLTAAAKTMHEYLAEWGNDYAKALASYNGGPSAMRRWIGAYGTEWRAALRQHPNLWPGIAGYGDASKAEEVAKYLDIIIGPDSATEGPMPGTITKWSPHRGGKRPRTLGVVIHSTRGGKPNTLEQEYQATIGWFLNQASGVSAHAVVGPDETCLMVPHADIAFHAREHNQTHLGIEVCQPYPTTPYTEAHYRQAARLCREWATLYGFPLLHVSDASRPGILGHDETAAGIRDGKTDPGPMWDWEYFVSLLADDPTPNPPADQEAVWAALCDKFADVAAAADRGSLVSTPGLLHLPGDTEPLTPERAAGEIGRVLEEMRAALPQLTDLYGQLEV